MHVVRREDVMPLLCRYSSKNDTDEICRERSPGDAPVQRYEMEQACVLWLAAGVGLLQGYTYACSGRIPVGERLQAIRPSPGAPLRGFGRTLRS